MVGDERQDRSALLDRYIAFAAAFALLWLLEQTIPVVALVAIVILGCAGALGYSRLIRRLEERRELLAWVERNTFPDQTIGEWLAESNGRTSLQEATSQWLWWGGPTQGPRGADR